MTASKHNTSSGDNSDAKNASTETENDRWEYTGTGTGLADGELFDAALRDRDTKVVIHPVRGDVVHFGIVVGEDTAGGTGFSADIHLSPDKAESLARDLLETAAAAREHQADE